MAEVISTSGVRLTPGDKAVVRFGHKRQRWVGEHVYFQRDNRRYYGRIIEARSERYVRRTVFGSTPAWRTVATVEVIEA